MLGMFRRPENNASRLAPSDFFSSENGGVRFLGVYAVKRRNTVVYLNELRGEQTYTAMVSLHIKGLVKI